MKLNELEKLRKEIEELESKLKHGTEVDKTKMETLMFDYEPVIDILELDADLSTAAEVSVDTVFDYITRVRFVQVVSDAAMEWTEFAEGVTLTNGFYMRLDGKQFGSIVKTAEDLAKLGDIRYTPSDADATKVAYIRQVTVDFTKMTPGSMGLQIQKASGGRRTFGVYGQDDMTACVKFQAIVEGYKVV